MQSYLSVFVKVIALMVLTCALYLSVLAAREFSEKLVQSGCLAQFFGGPTARSTSCSKGLLGLGAYFILTGLAWWALHGALLLIPRDARWGALASFAKYAGGMAGALVALLYVVPVAVVFFLYIVYPVLLFAGTGVVLLFAWLFGHVARAIGM